MSNKIKDELVNPIIVIDAVDEQNVKYWMQLMQVDPMLDNPAVWGEVLSELVKAIAASYAAQQGVDRRAVRNTIMRALRQANSRLNAQIDTSDPAVTVVTVGKPTRLN